jgi:hypothetical protein
LLPSNRRAQTATLKLPQNFEIPITVLIEIDEIAVQYLSTILVNSSAANGRDGGPLDRDVKVLNHN